VFPERGDRHGSLKTGQKMNVPKADFLTCASSHLRGNRRFESIAMLHPDFDHCGERSSRGVTVLSLR